MGTYQKPSHKWGYCHQCDHEVRWVLGTHHSGERCYKCPACHSWKAKPKQRNLRIRPEEAQQNTIICQLI